MAATACRGPPSASELEPSAYGAERMSGKNEQQMVSGEQGVRGEQRGSGEQAEMHE